MSASLNFPAWVASDAREWIRIPAASDDKYSHGSLGVFTGSTAYPGAAVLSVEAAARSGIGLIRYFGPAEPSHLVLERRPEVVTVPGRVDAYVIGSGVDPAELAADPGRNEAIMDALVSGAPIVLDAGALDFAARTTGPTVITPHARELARLLTSHAIEISLDEVLADPARWAAVAAEEFAVTVVLKGAHTLICSPGSSGQTDFVARVESSTSWMATAGTGDVLAGITGALIATHAQQLAGNPHHMAQLAATAVFVHAEAGYLASAGGPLVALDVAETVPQVIASLIAGRG